MKNVLVKLVKAIVLIAVVLLVVNLCMDKYVQLNDLADGNGIVGGPLTRRIEGYKLNKQLRKLPSDGLDMSTRDAETEEKQKNTPSDIAGMTQYDKVQAGLLPEDGSDSDHDGLTDKEEIEIYHGDPLKESTAGDLYSDGYKVEHDMDLNQKYEYEGTPDYDNNEVKDQVSLDAAYPQSIHGNVKEKSNDYYHIEGANILKTYNLCNFGGRITLHLRGLVNKRYKTKDLVYYVGKWQGGDMFKVRPFSDNGQDVTLDYDFEPEYHYGIIVCDGPGKASILRDNISGLKPTGVVHKAVHGTGVFFHKGYFSYLSKPSMLYVPTGDEEVDHQVRMDLVACARKAADICEYDESDVKEISRAEYNILMKFFDTFLPSHKISPYVDHPDDEFLRMFVFLYCDYDMIAQALGRNQEEDEAEYAYFGPENPLEQANYDEVGAELPFENFGTEYSPNGNCAGITYFTMQLYNTGTFPSDGHFYVSSKEKKGKDYQYDLTKDPENSTLLDFGLEDYKTESFVQDHVGEDGLLTGLTDGEQQFVNMISVYWAAVNHNITLKKKTLGQSNYDASVFRLITDTLDTGRTIGLAIYGYDKVNKKGGGHVVLVSGYHQDKKDPTLYYLDLYDCNYPYGHVANTEYMVNTKMRVQKIKGTYDHEDTFIYYYDPMENYGTEVDHTIYESGCDEHPEYFFVPFGEDMMANFTTER